MPVLERQVELEVVKIGHAEAARKRYPLSIMIIVIGVLVIPFPFLFIRYALRLADPWYAALGVVVGVVIGSVVIGLGSLVEDIHDISMHTAGYDMELGELPEEEYEEEYEEGSEEVSEEVPAEAEKNEEV